MPTGTATFDTSTTTSLTFSSGATLGTLQFNADAPGYTFNITSGGIGHQVVLNGSGIVLGQYQTTNNNGGLLTFEWHHRGNATINNSGSLFLPSPAAPQRETLNVTSTGVCRFLVAQVMRRSTIMAA